MEAEIRAIIDKNLPNQVGEVLKERLEQAEEDAQEVKRLRKEVQEKVAYSNMLQEKLDKYKSMDDRNDKLDQREKDLDHRDKIISTQELDYKLGAEKDKSQFLKDVMMGLVKNVEYRREIFHNKSIPTGTDQYGQIKYGTESGSTTEVNKVSE